MITICENVCLLSFRRVISMLEMRRWLPLDTDSFTSAVYLSSVQTQQPSNAAYLMFIQFYQTSIDFQLFLPKTRLSLIQIFPFSKMNKIILLLLLFLLLLLLLLHICQQSQVWNRASILEAAFSLATIKHLLKFVRSHSSLWNSKVVDVQSLVLTQLWSWVI